MMTTGGRQLWKLEVQRLELIPAAVDGQKVEMKKPWTEVSGFFILGRPVKLGALCGCFTFD